MNNTLSEFISNIGSENSPLNGGNKFTRAFGVSLDEVIRALTASDGTVLSVDVAYARCMEKLSTFPPFFQVPFPNTHIVEVVCD